MNRKTHMAQVFLFFSDNEQETDKTQQLPAKIFKAELRCGKEDR